MKKRPFGLIAIVCYKSFVSTLLMVTAIAIFFAVKNYQSLETFSDNYVLEGKARIIEWIVEKILSYNRKTLAFSGVATGIYAIVTAIEAVGLWYQKSWAHILVLGLLGISIPPEIYELILGISPVKLIVFFVNVGILWYLLRNFTRPQH